MLALWKTSSDSLETLLEKGLEIHRQWGCMAWLKNGIAQCTHTDQMIQEWK